MVVAMCGGSVMKYLIILGLFCYSVAIFCYFVSEYNSTNNDFYQKLICSIGFMLGIAIGVLSLCLVRR